MLAVGLFGQTACNAWMAMFSRMVCAWGSAHQGTTGTQASVSGATATVSSARVPMSAHAVKSHFSSSKPGASKNVRTDTLQIMRNTNAQLVIRAACSAATETGVTYVAVASF